MRRLKNKYEPSNASWKKQKPEGGKPKNKPKLEPRRLFNSTRRRKKKRPKKRKKRNKSKKTWWQRRRIIWTWRFKRQLQGKARQEPPRKAS